MTPDQVDKFVEEKGYDPKKYREFYSKYYDDIVKNMDEEKAQKFVVFMCEGMWKPLKKPEV